MNEASIIPRSIAAPDARVSIPQGNDGLQQVGEAVTQFGEAMAKARDQSQLTSARLGYSTKLDDLAQQYMRDPDPATAPQRFAKDAQEAAQGYYEGFRSDEARNAFTMDAGQLAESRRVSMMDLSFRRESDQAVASLDALGEKSSRDAAFAANPAERSAAINAYAKSAMGTADAGLISHEAAGKMVEGFQEKLALYDGRALVEKNPVLAKKQLADPNFLPSLDPLARVELSSQSDAKIRQREAEAKAALAEARMNASASLADLDSTIGSGLPVAKAVIDQARADVRAAGDPRLALHLDRSMRSAYFADGLRGANSQQVEGALEQISGAANTQGADPAMAAAFSGGRKFLETMNQGLARDPLSWAAQQGVVQIAPLGLTGQDSNQAWQGRIRAADAVAQHYGTEPRYLTSAEEQTLKTQLVNGGDAATRMTALKNVVGGLGSRAIPELQRLGATPALITAGGLLTQGGAHVHTAFDILNGETALASTDKRGEGLGALRPSETARTLTTPGAGRIFGGVTLPQGMPQVMQATSLLPGEAARISAAADAIYAARAGARGLTGKDAGGAGEGIYQRAIQEAAGARFEGETQMGGISSYRGRPVIVPATIAADSFEGIVNHLSADDLAQASASGAAPVDASGKKLASDFIRHAYMVTAGNGLYALSTTDPASGAITPVRDAKGGIYRLNFPAAFTLLQARSAKAGK